MKTNETTDMWYNSDVLSHLTFCGEEDVRL